MSTLLVTPEAELDLASVHDYYEDKSAGLGVEFLVEVAETLDRILTHPESYEERAANTRRAITHRFPYGIFYLLEDGAVTVVAVAHLSRDPSTWLRRLDTQ